MSESIIPNLNMSQLLGAEESNPEPKSALENALSTVTPEDAAATSVAEVKFQFRDLLDKTQLAELKTNAPAVAEKMVTDLNSIIQFGEPVLTKLNAGSVQLLEAQKDIKVPEADVIVNDLLRQIDGYAAKYRNAQLEGFFNKVGNFFRGATYTLKAMVRESKPIVEKLDMAEGKLREMEIKLADNVTRGQQLYKNTTSTLEDVVAVLAALEEIIEVARGKYAVIDGKLKEAEAQGGGIDSVVAIEYEGKTVSLNELRAIHTDYATGISELEKTWFDWRQQFFLGYAQAPTARNLILVSATMQRRCQVFRTMGIPSSRTALATWQQAALAKEGAEMGTSVQEGTNRLIQAAAQATGEAVAQTAMASQAPVISEETIFSIINSIKAQCDGLVAADKWGRAQRARNLAALEAGEVGIQSAFTESRRQLVQNAIAGVQEPQELAPAPDADILSKMGVKG